LLWLDQQDLECLLLSLKLLEVWRLTARQRWKYGENPTPST